MPTKKKRATRKQVTTVQRPRQRNRRKQQRQPPVVRMEAKRTKSKAAPVAISTGTTVVTQSSRAVTYQRKEFVQQMTTPSTQDGQPYTGNLVLLDLNPGLLPTFPWLSTVCSFEQYRFKRLRFEFQSSTPTSTPGQVVMVTNVDVKDPIMTTDREVLSYSGAATGRVWDSHSHSVPRQAMVNKNYVRVSAVPQNADKSLYDVGLFYLRCLGVPANTSLGTLWVDYEIEFYNPKVLSVAPSKTLKIRGDRKTVKSDEPFGEDAKLREDGQSGVKWSCPPDSSRPGYCQIKVWPEGMTNFSATAYTGHTIQDGKGVPPEMNYDGGQVLDPVIDFATGFLNEVEDLGVLSSSGFASLMGKLSNPTEALDLFYKLGPGVVAPAASNIEPNLLINLWK